MKIKLYHNKTHYVCDLENPIDLSIPIAKNHVLAWGMSDVKIEPVKDGDWIGDVSQGGPVNFNNIFFNPHAHGTHTECIGHISSSKESLNSELSSFFFLTQVISVTPEKINGDNVITKKMICDLFTNKHVESLIIRTLPNNSDKLKKDYSNTNPPYFSKAAMDYIVEMEIKHLLIDLPSVDKEDDAGALLAHKTFWNYPENPRCNCTITELIYVDNHISDDVYLLNLQFVSFQNDASPSRPVIFKLIKEKE